ncbi:hemolysin family protein [Marmoricola endophyticus]|uniref:hemolysin family protein n=1 Tax=Marmoricola endophyticus TaxID=2040280 RepID=UPI00166EB004|nr:hemolysin family protein [Marmoricola endophyticus]
MSLDLLLVVVAAALVVVAGLLSSAEAALSAFSRARAEELVAEQRPGARALLAVTEDPPRVLSTTLLLRLLAEISAIVLATVLVLDTLGGSDTSTVLTRRWPSILVAIAVMLVVSFVLIGVAPRTLGRQHAERVALLSAGPLRVLTRVLGPGPRLLILVGNAITPGRGFSEGPFASEAELRELVDLAEASQLIEGEERAMIHSVFELGDTIAREVMVPRTDVVFVERHKTLRQTMSLLLRSGYSRLPVIGEDLDEVVGFAYLKDISQRLFDRNDARKDPVESVMRPVLHVPDSKPADDLLREMQADRRHIAMVVDEYGGTAGLVTIEDILEEIVGEIADEHDAAGQDVEELPEGLFRVSSRFPVDDLEDLVGIRIVDDEIDSVGGLMAKHLGKVPLPGSRVDIAGLRLEAESTSGRRNRIGSVLISRAPAVVEVPEPTR